ncbi:MAG: pyridoxal phosphate-dependent aminotransferase [Bacteroidetes bacterium]|nr:MAG: pyridoxal phosphate-dependent aminotransferase [Bacteroidota bacterium]TAG87303.1 MAG: pyridoxal phosphate-dependent aminotransferase [Bacteroidota bacterium]
MNTKEIIAERINRLAESETIAMAKKAREIAALGHNVVKLNFGEPDFNTPEHVKEAAKKAIDDNFSFYTPVAGIPELRKAIAEKLRRDNQLDWQAENIIVSTGAKQTIANAILTMINPGDEVIVFAPYWVTYKEIIKLAEGKMVIVEAGVENGFKVSPEQLKNAITPKTKAILYSSPSNPTGAVYTRKELEALAEVLIPHQNIYIIADEIYEYISFLDEPYFSIGSIPALKERTITVNGYAKGFAMTGWRVGYMAAPKWIVDACDKLQGQFTSATCSIAQKAALAATEGSLESVKKMTEIYKHRRDLMLEQLKQIPHIKTYIPDGAFYIFPDVSAYFGKSFGDKVIKNSEDLCMYLIEEVHVALVSGAAFGMDSCIRISYAASDENLKEAVKRIKEGLAKLK